MDLCLECKEEVTEAEKEFGELATLMKRTCFERHWVHRECRLRQTIGSLAHQQHKCSCYGGTEEDTTPGMTKRQNAQAAVDYYEKHTSLLVERLSDLKD